MAPFCGLCFRLVRGGTNCGLNVDIELHEMELHELKKGAFLHSKYPLGQGLNTTSVLGLPRPPASELSLVEAGCRKPFDPPALLLLQVVLTGSTMPCFP